MKFTLASILALSASASAHTIFYQVAVNGQVKPAYSGVRAQNSNNPIFNVNAGDFACGSSDVKNSNAIITVNAGDKIGTYWQHVPGQDGTNDADNPIAASHKGPLQAYLAKVDNAATANGAAQKWTKIASDGLNLQTGRWAVDDLISNAGWWNFNLPTCIAPGDYLLRAEIIAHHESSEVGKAQFYISCAQIRVVAGGSTSLAGQGITFPGAYSPTDPGIQVSIYGPDGKPNNGLKPYKAPGPAVFTCAAGSGPIVTPKPTTTAAPTTMVTATKPAATTPAPQPPVVQPPVVQPPTTNPGGAALYGQCGGNGFTGPKTCAVGTCKYQNDWYSQCLN